MKKPTSGAGSVGLRFLIVLLVPCLTGCGVFEELTVSVPAEIPPGVTGTITGGITRLQVPGLTVSLEMQNFRSTGRSVLLLAWSPWSVPLREKAGGTVMDLLAWFAFEPSDVRETFGFDPRHVTVRTVDRERVEPRSFIGPSSEVWTSPLAVARGCGKRRYTLGTAASKTVVEKGDVKQPEASVPFHGPSCFVLRFDVPRDAERNLGLSIEGIERGGRVLPVPELKLEKQILVKSLVVP